MFFSWAASVKVNTPCNDRIAIDAEKLVMGNGVIGIDLREQPRIGEEVSGGIWPGTPTLIEDDLDVYPWVWASIKAIAMGAEVKLEVWTRMLVLAGRNILTIMSVQFPLGMKQTITLARFVALLEPLASPISNSPSVSIGRITHIPGIREKVGRPSGGANACLCHLPAQLTHCFRHFRS